jgi:putative ATPase
VEFVGMPEARIILSQAATYLATAPKSNSAYKAIDKALKDVKNGRTLQVPDRLKNKKMETVGSEREEYIYPHDYAGHYVEQEYIPAKTKYYKPGTEGYEDIIGKRMKRWEKRRS